MAGGHLPERFEADAQSQQEQAGRISGSFPQWHYFDNNWWQVDD